jgi:hypothetical protein
MSRHVTRGPNEEIHVKSSISVNSVSSEIRKRLLPNVIHKHSALLCLTLSQNYVNNFPKTSFINRMHVYNYRLWSLVYGPDGGAFVVGFSHR